MSDGLLDTAGIVRDLGARLERGAERAAKKELKKRMTAAQIEAAAHVRTFTRQTQTFGARAVAAEQAGDPDAARFWARHALRTFTNLDRIRQALVA